MKYVRSHMKKLLLFFSLVSMFAWIALVFMFRLSGFVHILLFVSILFYLRSLMLVEPTDTPVAPGLGSSEV